MDRFVGAAAAAIPAGAIVLDLGAGESRYRDRFPGKRYFAVDLVTKDQVENYAIRKGMPVAAAERWLAPNLAYEAE